MTTRIVTISVAVLSFIATGCGRDKDEVEAAQRLSPIEQNVAIPATERITLRTQGCGVLPAADILIEGAIDLLGVAGRIEFRDQLATGTSAAQTAFADPVPARAVDRLTLPRDANPTDARFDPEVTVQLLDANGAPVGEPLGLGRCSSGGATLEIRVPVQARARMRALALACDASPGAQVEMSGELELFGSTFRFTFTDLNAAPNGDRPVQAVADLSVIPAGQRIELPATRLQSLVDDPTLWANFVDANGRPLSEPEHIGGCGSNATPPLSRPGG